MSSARSFAVLIGINEYQDSKKLSNLNYAEKDARDLYDVLITSHESKFFEENTSLVCGQQATTDYIREILYKNVVKNPTPEDTVLVYFSGHGFILGKQPKRAYLGTFDVDISTLLTKNQRAGLRMDELHEDIFMASPAKYVLFVLDSCHSGAFIPSSIKGLSDDIKHLDEYESLLDKGFFSTKEGRVAIVSSPANLPSYESSNLKNSIFTHYLLEGLRGEAVEKGSREISLDSLMSYIRNHMPSEQIPGRYGHDFGRIVLTQVANDTSTDQLANQIIFPNSNKKPTKKQISTIIPLRNPLSNCEEFIRRLMNILSDEKFLDGPNIDVQILESIRQVSNASFVIVLRKDRDFWHTKAQSSLSIESNKYNQGDYLKTVVDKVGSIISLSDSSKIISDKGHHGIFHVYQDDGESKTLVILPLGTKHTIDFMVLYGLSADTELCEESYGRILTGIYHFTKELTILEPSLLEASILDTLKEVYGYLPLGLYTRRKKLFTERLQQMNVKFEPVLYLRPGYLHIDGWEALARAPYSDKAPVDLFKAAEIWGDEFTIELDGYFLQYAVDKYCSALAKVPGMQRSEDMRELSVNVYPESLMRSAYYRNFKHIVKGIQPEKLVLEISEKTPEPSSSRNLNKTPIDAFRDQLARYVEDFSIAFAIDDFGVGHASINRLAGLNPLHVKIDREVLRQGALDLTLEFVKKLLIRRYLRVPKIIIEGVDRKSIDIESPVSLGKLHKAGVTYIQGHIMGLASDEPFRLDPEDRDQFQRLLETT